MPEGILLRRPAVFDPSTASVFDSPGEQLARRVIEFFGGGEPAEEVANMVGIMPLGSPVRRAAFRGDRLAALAKQARDISPQVGEAFDHLAKRFPRMTSHIRSISGIDSPGIQGMFSPSAAVDPKLPSLGTVGAIDINPKTLSAMGIPARRASAVDTLAHELTHGAQTLRAADRHRRALTSGRTTLPSLNAAQKFGDLDFLPPDQFGASRYLSPNDIAAAEIGPSTVGINQAKRFMSGSRTGAARVAERSASANDALAKVARQLDESPNEVMGMLAWLREALER